MKFLLFNAIGALSLALVNAFFRANPYGWSLFVLLLVAVIPTTFGTQYGFASAYKVAPSFYSAWFTGTAFTSIAGFLTSLFIFGEQIKLLNILGIILILGGAYCLIK